MITKLKNRDGEADKVVGMRFLGETGSFDELPRGIDMKEIDYTVIEQIKKSI